LIVFFSILGSIGAIILSALLLFLKKNTQEILIPSLISYATGTLLAAALLGLIPKALESNLSSSIFLTVLMGIVLFFTLEKLVIWRHCHDKDCSVHGIAGPMLLIGDAVHNATDGLVIAASFLTSASIGIAVSLSIIAHEIPQEIGDFAILLHSGYSKRKALSLNLLSSISTLPAAIIAYYALDAMQNVIPYVMALSASSFLYIALVDLYPELHLKTGSWSVIRQLIMMILGIGTMILLL
jgi:zinc and cadmium transporter